MIFQTGMTPKLAEAVYRSCLSSTTKTTTITAATIGLGVGMPVILETNSASVNGYHVQAPTTASDTPVENNLFIGCLDHSLGTNSAYLLGEDAGVVQCYGYDSDAIVAGATASIAAGCGLVPDLGYLIVCGSPVTASAATATAAHGIVYGLAGLAYAAGVQATVSATDVTKAPGVFLRCM